MIAQPERRVLPLLSLLGAAGADLVISREESCEPPRCTDRLRRPQPLNAGVLFVRAAPSAAALLDAWGAAPVSYTHLRAHETLMNL
eukprot:1084380-Prymnesium_polylepis.1